MTPQKLKEYVGNLPEELDDPGQVIYDLTSMIYQLPDDSPEAQGEVHNKSVKALEDFLQNQPEEAKRIMEEVEGMGFEGPSVQEYLDNIGGQQKFDNVDDQRIYDLEVELSKVSMERDMYQMTAENLNNELDYLRDMVTNLEEQLRNRQ